MTNRGDITGTERALVEEDGERRVGPADEITVSTLDRGLLYGDAVFETLRCYDGAPAFLGRHVSRLEEALDAARIDAEINPATVQGYVDDLVDEGDAYVRVTVTRGKRDGLLGPTEDTPTVIVHAKPVGQRRYSPATVETVTEPRPVGIVGRHKTACYLPNIVARDEAESADEAIMLAEDTVASGTVSNVFVVRDGAVETPADRVRNGVTREIVLDEARGRYETRIGEVTVEDADTVFLTNTTWGVRPVESFDGREYDTHPVVEELADAYLRRALESAGV
ncbi:MAG: aminotransferase class IV [Halobacteriales archaeon]